MPKLLFLVSEDSYFCSHRLNLAKAAILEGFQVAVATKCKQHQDLIEKAGIQVFPLQFFNRSGIHPWRQFCTLKELIKIYRKYQPDIVHHVAIKPVLLGSIIAKWCKVPKVINALGGLGYLFTETPSQIIKKSVLQKLKKAFLFFFVCRIYRWAFSQENSILLLQNKDDKKLLIDKGCVRENKLVVIPGSGIDKEVYAFIPPPTSSIIIISCISRMLWDKGIGELVSAAKILHAEKLPIKILLHGLPDPENPASISCEIIESWHASKIIEWRQYCHNVAKSYAESHIAVLPSYREGLPKSLLEAASCGRPIVTTNVPGCREVVKDGENGFLVNVQDANDLAEKLRILIQDEALRLQMGHAGRQRIEDYFSNEKIHSEVLKLYRF